MHNKIANSNLIAVFLFHSQSLYATNEGIYGVRQGHAFCCKFGMTLAKLETREELNCVSAAYQGVNKFLYFFLNIPLLRYFDFINHDQKFSASPRLSNSYFFLLDGVTGLANGKHPVWCDENTPIDLSLFKTAPNTLNAPVFLSTVDSAVPALITQKLEMRRQSICEDP
jgi:hypothetical protein